MRLTHGRRPFFPAALGALALVGGSAALAATQAGRYSGRTAQGLPLRFGVSHAGKRVRNFEPTFTANCRQRGLPNITTPRITTDTGRDIAIKTQKFSTRGHNGKVLSGSQVIATGTDTVSGRFVSDKSAKGTYSVRIRFANSAPGGLAGYDCSTGKLKWSAKAR